MEGFKIKILTVGGSFVFKYCKTSFKLAYIIIGS